MQHVLVTCPTGLLGYMHTMYARAGLLNACPVLYSLHEVFWADNVTIIAQCHNKMGKKVDSFPDPISMFQFYNEKLEIGPWDEAR